jgi:hypothetical protein
MMVLRDGQAFHGLDVLCSLTEMTARPIGGGGHGR